MIVRAILSILLTTMLIHVKAQSAWDIRYIKMDAVGEKDIGREVKPDFLSGKKSNDEASWRYFISSSDTATLTIDNVEIRFVEKRKIRADWGLYREQFLESVSNTAPDTKLRITGTIIKAVTKDSILLASTVDVIRFKKKKEEKTGSRVHDIFIPKNRLSGLIYQQ
jgi:hypothetical protein